MYRFKSVIQNKGRIFLIECMSGCLASVQRVFAADRSLSVPESKHFSRAIIGQVSVTFFRQTSFNSIKRLTQSPLVTHSFAFRLFICLRNSAFGVMAVINQRGSGLRRLERAKIEAENGLLVSFCPETEPIRGDWSSENVMVVSRSSFVH